MSDPRTVAFAALRESEAAAKELPEVLTLQTLCDLKTAAIAQAAALRRALEWVDAIETP